ncbi:glucosamine-6-phosphate deaminase [Pelagirhabdus alkalitolerans]|uniref:Glucosamine-6-phosphate deaminase n=1 Tax=Pelagirhabdus alkalitolerans TaxID=1612202 RepID=A0A1G6GJQ2_9BACI|nr:glucosamine-6-phosphate deaminase [Pelagirhabdus alkalitolerans]SDB82231.1 glucosamine-6-phosphate deaminase [Pelagirhabdus alkalitolerans]
MHIIKVKDYTEMSRYAAQHVIKTIEDHDEPVLGLATGSTPEGMYNYLIEAYQKQKVSFENVTTFNLDEYIGVPATDENSYHYFMEHQLFKHIDVDPNHTHLPDGNTDDPQKECLDYEKALEDAGNIDLQVLGLGLNGHIGFNEPGTPFSSRTHVIELDESTRKANARFFDRKEDVPTHAITMGIDSIMDSKEIILMVSGEKKKEAVKQLVDGDISESFPASVLKKHPNVTLIVDHPAAELID